MSAHISSVSVHRYCIPFVKPFTSSWGTVTQREGLLILVEDDRGMTGVGEAAPLPGFTNATIDEVEKLVSHVAPVLTGVDPVQAMKRLSSSVSCDSSGNIVRFGLESALYDLHGKQVGKSVATLIWSDPTSYVPVNASIGVSDTTDAIAAAQAAIADDYRTLKLKVGFTDDTAYELGRINAVAGLLPTRLQLRLDANESWSRTTALEITSQLDPGVIEFVEQPVSRNDFEGMLMIREHSPVPIAADEAVTSVEQARTIINAGAADILVLKPAIVGGISAVRQIQNLATSHGIDVVITTMLETEIGISAAIHLAAGDQRHHRAHGLATISLLKDRVAQSQIEVEQGVMKVPVGTGLGYELTDRMTEQVWRRIA